MAKSVLAGVVAVAIALAPFQAQAGERTFAVSDCRHVEIRPGRIMFACADGGYYVTSLEWQRWQLFRAAGQGLFHQNDCLPSCVEGTFHARRGRITLRRRMWCPDANRYVFRHATVVYDRPLLGQEGTSFRLFCPLEAARRPVSLRFVRGRRRTSSLAAPPDRGRSPGLRARR
jgi:hypothetical protein